MIVTTSTVPGDLTYPHCRGHGPRLAPQLTPRLTQQGPWQVLRVFVLYCVLHLFESYLLTPLVQKRAVFLPPGITVLAIVLMAAVGGVLGLMVAAPLTVVIIVLIKMIYIEDRLGDRDIEVPGEPAAQK